MGKFIVRLTIIFTAMYFVLACIVAQLFGVDIITNLYTIPFELCVVVYSFSEGKYHCKYIKYTALAILLSDVISQLDNYYDFLSIETHNAIPIYLIALGIFIGVYKAIKHYAAVIKIKKARRDGVV